MFFVKSNGEESDCPVCGGSLKYRDTVPRIMKSYNAARSTVMIERRKCQNPSCGKLHRCLPTQLTRFKHFMTEIIEDTADGVVVPEDAGDPTAEKEGEILESPAPRTVTRWRDWIRHNAAYINGRLKDAGYSILGLGTQFLSSGISLLDELRKDGSGWLATIQTIIYNSGGFLEPFY